MVKIKIGGHRGSGCTDGEFCKNVANIADRPTENSTASVITAFQNGADYVEIDVTMSKDEVIFTLHNVLPKDHFFGKTIPALMLNQMDFSDIQKFKPGRYQPTEIATLTEMLAVIAEHDPQTLPWAVCIEIKGVNGSHQLYEDNNFIETIANTIKESAFPEDRILWSSFCLQNIIDMSYHLPKSSYGMLFTETSFIQKVYSNKKDDFRYLDLPFEERYINFVLKCWEVEASKEAKLNYLHPEIMTVTLEKMIHVYDLGLHVNNWAYHEKWAEPFISQYTKMITYAQENNFPMSFITDYVREIKNLADH